MPYVMNYTAPTGTNYPNSYWTIRMLGYNPPNQTGHLIFFGYPDVATYDTDGDASKIAERRYDITDPAVYDESFALGNYPQQDAFLVLLEDSVLAIDDFFGTANVISFVKLRSVEVGSAGSSKVVVTFPAMISSGSATNTSGVVIKINGVAATITSAVQDPTGVITYTITETVEATDIVTWEYSPGGLEDVSSVPLQGFLPMTASNTVGEYWAFDDANNSGQFAIHF